MKPETEAIWEGRKGDGFWRDLYDTDVPCEERIAVARLRVTEALGRVNRNTVLWDYWLYREASVRVLERLWAERRAAAHEVGTQLAAVSGERAKT